VPSSCLVRLPYPAGLCSWWPRYSAVVTSHRAKLEGDMAQTVVSNLSSAAAAAHPAIKHSQRANATWARKGNCMVSQPYPVCLCLLQFHAQGRAPVYAYSNAFCEGGSNGTGLYYLASAADKVFMPPTGMVSLLGFASDQVSRVEGCGL
jgi:hypothetical protein